jgi:hypothetical protein
MDYERQGGGGGLEIEGEEGGGRRWGSPMLGEGGEL